MSLHRQDPGIGNMLFGNVKAKNISLNAAEGILQIQAIYDQREHVRIVYNEVYYSELNDNMNGIVITMAKQLKLDEIQSYRNAAVLMRLLSNCGTKDSSFLKELYKKGYYFFMHYASSYDEYLIVAKSIYMEN